MEVAAAKWLWSMNLKLIVESSRKRLPRLKLLVEFKVKKRCRYLKGQVSISLISYNPSLKTKIGNWSNLFRTNFSKEKTVVAIIVTWWRKHRRFHSLLRNSWQERWCQLWLITQHHFCNFFWKGESFLMKCGLFNSKFIMQSSNLSIEILGAAPTTFGWWISCANLIESKRDTILLVGNFHLYSFE